MRLSNLLLRKDWATENGIPFEDVRSDIKKRVVKLYQLLMQYQMKSVCAYYRFHRVVTFLVDQLQSDRWDGAVEHIKACESNLLQDVDRYNAQLALDLHNQLTQNTKELVDLTRQKLQDDRSTRVNNLIKAFTNESLQYEAFKNDLNEPPAPKTCEWFKTHDAYRQWTEIDRGVLVVAASPGCGKSVLARSLVDEFRNENVATVCHFFFKDNSLQNQAASGLCALLHQILTKHEDIVLKFEKTIAQQDKEALQNNMGQLWEIFAGVTEALPYSPVLCVLDGLDECQQKSREKLINDIKGLFTSKSPRLKIIVTCRPLRKILTPFREFKSHCIVLEIGDTEVAQIREEINHVIDYRLDELTKNSTWTSGVKIVEEMKSKLKAAKEQNYLWLRLTFQLLHENSDDKPKAWVQLIQRIPEGIHNTYEELLGRIPKDRHSTVRAILSLVVAARRPLKAEELNAALDLYHRVEGTYDETDEPTPIDEFKEWISNYCGFLVQIIEGSVQFIHQTVKEFLVNENSPINTVDTRSGTAPWKSSIKMQEAHRLMAEICIRHLYHRTLGFLEAGDTPLLRYCALNWVAHFRSAGIRSEEEMALLARDLCEIG